MKKSFFRIITLLMTVSFSIPGAIAAGKGGGGKTTNSFIYKIGDVGPAGGWIFYVDRFDEHPAFDYLEAAAVDASRGVVWATSTPNCYGPSGSEENCQIASIYNTSSCYDSPETLTNCQTTGANVTSQTSKAVGMGKANTEAIVARHDLGNVPKNEYAAGVADAYSTVVNGVTYEDWFLPSQGELWLMYINLQQAGVGSLDIEQQYWSSTQIRAYDAWHQNVTTNEQNGNYKYTSFSVRPVRAF